MDCQAEQERQKSERCLYKKSVLKKDNCKRFYPFANWIDLSTNIYSDCDKNRNNDNNCFELKEVQGWNTICSNSKYFHYGLIYFM